MEFNNRSILISLLWRLIRVDKNIANLTFELVNFDDEGLYKCEVTFLSITAGCPVVQQIRLVSMSSPSFVRIVLVDNNEQKKPVDVTGQLLGPYQESTEIVLRCEAGGGKPAPHSFWFMGDKLVPGEEGLAEQENKTGIVRNDLRLRIGRDVLGKKIICKVANEAMEKYMTGFVQIDVNLPSVSIVISGPLEEVREGEQIHLACSSGGARPAAVLSWYNGSLDNPLDNSPAREVSVLQGDGTYATSSQIVFIAQSWHNNKWLLCEATSEKKRSSKNEQEFAKYLLRVRYSPKVQIIDKRIFTNHSGRFFISCKYHANPPKIIKLEWLHNNEKIDLRNHKYQMKMDGHPTLVVYNVSVKDAGNYSCLLYNMLGYGKPETPAIVEVQTRPRVKLTMDPVSSLIEGEERNVSLGCQVQYGHPARLIRVKWFMDGVLLQELPQCDTSGEIGSSLCGIDPTQLLLESVNRHFHGNFSCIGVNKAGASEMSLPIGLEVQYKPGKPWIEQNPKDVFKGANL